MKFSPSPPNGLFTGRLLGFCLLLTILLPLACRRQAPVKLGFIGGLTGHTADLGMAGRDGAMLAIEQFNEAGGLNGRPVILDTADDRQDPDTARKALRWLIDAGSVAFIGPMTSQMAVAALPVSRQAGVALLSPTTSTDQLSGLDDTFFRLYPSNRDAARQLAQLAYGHFQLRRITAVWDEGNRAHTVTWLANFRQAFADLGGQLVASLAFESEHTAFAPRAQQVADSGAEALFILANGMDTGLLCQSLAKVGVELPVGSSEWSSTVDMAAFGGRAIEGMVCLRTFDKDHRSPRFVAFCELFRRRFGYEPGFAAVHGFDAASILLQALEQGQRPAEIVRFLKDRRTFAVLQGTLQLDAQGDVQRDLFPAILRDGQFQALQTP